MSYFSRASSGGSGSDNVVTVADITARDALTPDSNVIVKVIDASDHADVDSGIAWFQYNGSTYDLIAESESANIELASTTTAGLVRKATGAEITAESDVEAFTSPSQVATLVDGKVISYNATSPASLETASPASSNSGRFAWVEGGTAVDGLYRSNGTLWVKVADDAGDRTNMWDYGAGNTFLSTNETSTVADAGTSISRDVNETAGSNPDYGFDTNTSSNATNSGTKPIAHARIWDSSSYALGKFIFKTRLPYISSFKIVGYASDPGTDPANASNYTELTPTSVTNVDGDHSGSISSNTITISGTSLTSGTLEIITDNTTVYVGYGVLVTGGTGGHELWNFEGYEVVDATGTQNVVNSLNKVAQGYLTGEDDITSTSVNLEISDEGFVPCDATGGAITLTLPGVTEAGAIGKVFVVKKIDSGGNSVTLDGDGSETIDGATTYALSNENDSVAVRCDGDEWHILYKVDSSSGAVDSVNGNTGTVVLDPDDLDDSATTNKFTTAGDISKLAGIEAGADVTDATNVDSAGAVMNSDTSTASMSFVVDEDTMSSNSATKLATQQSIKAYVDSEVSGISSGLPSIIELSATNTTDDFTIPSDEISSSGASQDSRTAEAWGLCQQDASNWRTFRITAFKFYEGQDGTGEEWFVNTAWDNTTAGHKLDDGATQLFTVAGSNGLRIVRSGNDLIIRADSADTNTITIKGSCRGFRFT